MCMNTNDVLASPSFEEVELSTVLTILDQDCLVINSEMDLFLALVRYAEKHGHGKLICKYFLSSMKEATKNVTKPFLFHFKKNSKRRS